MDVLNHLLQSEQTMTLLLIIFTAVWSVVKSSEFWQRHKADRYATALAIIDAAVQQTYEVYVRPQKAENGGKLPEDARSIALRLAVQTARGIAEGRGIDLEKIIGHDRLIASEVQNAVNEAKRQ